MQSQLITLTKMSTDEFRGTHTPLLIEYSFQKSNLGNLLIASSPIGVVYVGFVSTKNEALHDLKRRFPFAKFKENYVDVHTYVLQFLNDPDIQPSSPLVLHLNGTDFQFDVWKILLKIKRGKTASYTDLAKKINAPDAVRAVGTAIGKNPIAVLIPCHRVTKSNGTLGNYHWGRKIKARLLQEEKAT